MLTMIGSFLFGFIFGMLIVVVSLIYGRKSYNQMELPNEKLYKIVTYEDGSEGMIDEDNEDDEEDEHQWFRVE